MYFYMYFNPTLSFMNIAHISTVEQIGPFLYISKIRGLFRRNKITQQCMICSFFPGVKITVNKRKGENYLCNHFWSYHHADTIVRYEMDYYGYEGMSRTHLQIRETGHLISELKLKCLTHILVLRINTSFFSTSWPLNGFACIPLK